MRVLRVGCEPAGVLCHAGGLGAAEHEVCVVCVLEFCAALCCAGSRLCAVRCVLSWVLGVCCALVVFIMCGAGLAGCGRHRVARLIAAGVAGAGRTLPAAMAAGLCPGRRFLPRVHL